MRSHMLGVTALSAVLLSIPFTNQISAQDERYTPDAGVRLYFSLPLHRQTTSPERSSPRLGLQLFGAMTDADAGSDLITPHQPLFEAQPLMDFGVTQHGVGKLDFLGADVLDAYENSEHRLDFITSMVTSIVTTGLVLVAIPVGAAIYCDRTNCVDRFKKKAEDEVRAEISSSIPLSD